MIERKIKSLLSSCGQLLAGWVALALCTGVLSFFPDFPVFSVVNEQTGDHGIVRRTHRRVARHDNAVGMWVVCSSLLLCGWSPNWSSSVC